DLTSGIALGTTYIVVTGNTTGAKGILRVNVMPMDVQFDGIDGTTAITADSKVFPRVAVGGTNKASIDEVGTTMAGITDGGVLYTWGDNKEGQLGIELSADAVPYSTTPVIAMSSDAQATKVAVGDGFMIALSSTGDVYAWGRNDYGQLGLGHTNSVNKPTQISGVGTVVDIAVGDNHTLLLTNTGDIYAFGLGSNHQVIPESDDAEPVTTPQKLFLKDSIHIAAVFAESNTSYALTRGGDIIVWGENKLGKFGNAEYEGTGVSYVDASVVEGGTERFITMSAATNSILALTTNSKVYGWGNNNYNQLAMQLYDMTDENGDPVLDGNGDNVKTYNKVVYEPTLSYVYNEQIDDETWQPIGITAGESSYVTYRATWEEDDGLGGTTTMTDRRVRVHGNNTDKVGELGIDFRTIDGDAVYENVIDEAIVELHAGDSDPSNHYGPFYGAVSIATSSNGMNSLIFDEYGKIYAWGRNNRGQIGDGTQDSREYPAEVLLDGGGAYLDFSQASLTRDSQTSAIRMYYDTIVRDTGILETAVRQGDTIQITLNAVTGIIGFTLFGQSSYMPHDLEFWSVNTDVADFTGKNAATGRSSTGTIQVGSKTGVTYIIAKDSRENFGIVKLNVIPAGNETQSVMPMVAQGAQHTVALKADGTVWTWGDNTFGQSGSGSKTIHITNPVQVMKKDTPTSSPTALTDVIKIASGGYHSLALTSDGHVYAWGIGVKGALGNDAKSEFNIQSYAIKVYGGKHDDGSYYYLGDSSEGSAASSQAVAGSKIIDIAAAGAGYGIGNDTTQYSFALDADGNVYGWGFNKYGVVSPQDASIELGSDFTLSVTVPRNITSRNTIIKGTRKLVADKLGDTIHVLKADGQVISWGNGANGEYGIGDLSSTSPSRAILPDKAIAAFAGTRNAAAILKDGTVAMWGDLNQGQLGYGNDANYLGTYRTPVLADNFAYGGIAGSFPLGGDISEYVQIFYANGGYDGMAWLEDNFWSAGTYGSMLGQGDDSSVGNPAPMARVHAGKSDLDGKMLKNVVFAANGITDGDYSVVVTDNGAVWAYGNNEYGKLGDNTTEERFEPVRVGTAYFLFDEYIKSLRVGDMIDIPKPAISSFNLLNGSTGTSTDNMDLKWQFWDGSLNGNQHEDAYGRITYETLGSSSDKYAHLTGLKEGTSYVIVSLSDDSLTVGTFKVEVRPANATIDNEMSVAYPQVVSGTNTTYALKPNGTVWAWGGNEYGQLGTGKIFGTAVYPQQVEIKNSAGNNVLIKRLAAAGDSVLAIDVNGHVWAWAEMTLASSVLAQARLLRLPRRHWYCAVSRRLIL
ncbi:MAG: hypothetical protein IJH36_03045, partial [Clostridia bacterium]|nr:hypothetical protein [Clostridia bacterium]